MQIQTQMQIQMQTPAGSTTKRVLQQKRATGTNLQQVEFQTLF